MSIVKSSALAKRAGVPEATFLRVGVHADLNVDELIRQIENVARPFEYRQIAQGNSVVSDLSSWPAATK